MARGGRNALDIAGQKFNYLLAVSKTGERSGKHVVWEFLCDCGRNHRSTATDVKRGTTKSCGCMQGKIVSKIKTTHGATKNYKQTRTYMIWCGMKKRCSNPNTKHYENYGGRGIKVCERWNSFENFLTDMGDAPLGLSIDRIDNNGNYEPSNCRWATGKEQGANRRSTVLISAGGETKCVTEWALTVGISQGALWRRLKNGMPEEEAIFTPLLQINARRRGFN
jgi:hypothetical protein